VLQPDARVGFQTVHDQDRPAPQTVRGGRDFLRFRGKESEAAINYLAHAQHNQFADVIAVAIDATDIDCFGIQAPPPKPNSLKAAVRQLQSLQLGRERAFV